MSEVSTSPSRVRALAAQAMTSSTSVPYLRVNARRSWRLSSAESSTGLVQRLLEMLKAQRMMIRGLNKTAG